MILYPTIRNIWLERNDKIFKKIGVNPTKTRDSIITQSFKWNKYMGNGLESSAERSLLSLFILWLYLNFKVSIVL